MENGILKNNLSTPVSFSHGFKPIVSPSLVKPSNPVSQPSQGNRFSIAQNNAHDNHGNLATFFNPLDETPFKYRPVLQDTSSTFESSDYSEMPGLLPKNLDFSAVSKTVAPETPEFVLKGQDLTSADSINQTSKEFSHTDLAARLDFFRSTSTELHSTVPYSDFSFKSSENSSSVSSSDTFLWTGAASDGEGFSTPPPSGSTSPVSELVISHASTSSTKSTNSKSTTQAAGQKRKGTPYIPSYMDLTNGPEPCVVCGDAATGYHYRCMTCEGCKGFFRRTIQKNLTYHCKWSSCCVIDKTTRNQCQQCRYNKCIAVGMATDLVLNEKQRVAKRKLIAENRHKRRSEMTSHPAAHAHCEHDTLSGADRALIDDIVKAYEQTTNRSTRDPEQKERSQEIQSLAGGSEAWQQLAEGLTPSIVKVVDFAKQVPGFLQMCMHDQILLLKSCCMEIMCLRAACRYSPADDRLYLQNGAQLTKNQIDSNTELGMLVEPLFELGVSLSKLQLDKCELAMLAAVLLMQSDRQGLREPEKVERLQDATLGAYKRYVEGARPAQPVRWAKILMKVTDLRSLSTRHAERLLAARLDAPGLLPPLLLQVFDERGAPSDVKEWKAQKSEVTSQNFQQRDGMKGYSLQSDVPERDVTNWDAPQRDISGSESSQQWSH